MTADRPGGAFFSDGTVAQGSNGIVVVRDIDFASTNEGTLLPFHGRAHIGYVPSAGVVLGLSKLARLTKHFGKRLQSQARLASDIASCLQTHLQCQVRADRRATHRKSLPANNDQSSKPNHALPHPFTLMPRRASRS